MEIFYYNHKPRDVDSATPATDPKILGITEGERKKLLHSNLRYKLTEALPKQTVNKKDRYWCRFCGKPCDQIWKLNRHW